MGNSEGNMSFSLGQIHSRLTLDLAPFAANLQKANRMAAGHLNKTDKEIAKIRKNRKEYIQNIRGKFKYLDS